MARHVDRERVRSAALHGAAQGVVDAWRAGNYGKLAAAIERLVEVLDDRRAP